MYQQHTNAIENLPATEITKEELEVLMENNIKQIEKPVEPLFEGHQQKTETVQ